MKRSCRRVLATTILVFSAAPALAQGWTAPSVAEPWKDAKMKIGPIFVAPSFGLKNVGVDNNVFRDELNPARDLTATIAVSTLFGAHIRAFTLQVTQANNYLWFRRYTSERSIDTGLTAMAELRLQRIRPWVSWSKATSHDRAGYEIDTRAAHTTPSYEVGTDVNLGFRTSLTISGSNSRVAYDEGTTFDGIELKKVLDNRTAFAHLNGKWQYSEFTDLVFGGEWTRNRFVNDPLRNADTLSYFGGFQSHGDAPFQGHANVGYKVQRHDDPAVPDFRGVVANANLSTVALDRVKFDLTADRDLNYSYDDRFPFYVQQGAGVSVTARVAASLDFLGSAKAEWLDYSRSLVDPDTLLPIPKRTDRATVYGIGFQYRMLGSGSHFGLTFERAQRMSPIDRKNYLNDRILTDIKLSF